MLNNNYRVFDTKWANIYQNSQDTEKNYRKNIQVSRQIADYKKWDMFRARMALHRSLILKKRHWSSIMGKAIIDIHPLHYLSRMRHLYNSIKSRSRGLFTDAGRLLQKTATCNGLLAWGLIVGSIALFLIPYNFKSPLELSTYNTFSLVPVVLAAIIRLRKGAIISWLLIVVTIVSYDIKSYGLSWPSTLVSSWFIGTSTLLFFGLIVGYICELSNKLHIAHQELTVAHEAIQKLALTDSLTKLPNHRAVIQCLETEYDRACRAYRPLSLIFFDCDHFKHINDHYGHNVGDSVLQELGHYASSVLRSGDIIGRLGGEEFIVVLPETDAPQAKEIAERLRATIAAQPLARSSVEAGINVTVSVGTATYPENGASSNALLKAADQTMYCAKRMGRNRVCSTSEIQDALGETSVPLPGSTTVDAQSRA